MDIPVFDRRSFVLSAAVGLMAAPARAAIGASIDVRDFGATGNGVSDDRPRLQAAIDACASMGGGTVFIPAGTFVLGVISMPLENDDGAVSLVLRSGVSLLGTGKLTVIRTQSAAYGIGAYYRLIGSDRSRPLSQVSVGDMTLDGARQTQIANVQAGGILLECERDIVVRNVRAINMNGTAIMLRGTPQKAAQRLSIAGCTVQNASYIGIQCSQFDQCSIIGNAIIGTGDNAIDIYGEAGSDRSNGANFVIEDNTIRDAEIGIFVETCRDGVVRRNTISARNIGLAINRINGEPRAVLMTANKVVSPTGARVSGDASNLRIVDNDFRGLTTSGVQLGVGSGNVSGVTVEKNRFVARRSGLPLVRTEGRQASFSTVRANTLSPTGWFVAPRLKASIHHRVDIDQP